MTSLVRPRAVAIVTVCFTVTRKNQAEVKEMEALGAGGGGTQSPECQQKRHMSASKHQLLCRVVCYVRCDGEPVRWKVCVYRMIRIIFQFLVVAL